MGSNPCEWHWMFFPLDLVNDAPVTMVHTKKVILKEVVPLTVFIDVAIKRVLLQVVSILFCR